MLFIYYQFTLFTSCYIGQFDYVIGQFGPGSIINRVRRSMIGESSINYWESQKLNPIILAYTSRHVHVDIHVPSILESGVRPTTFLELWNHYSLHL